MRVYLKVKKAQLNLFCQKQLKQAQKLALAVVVVEYILAGGYWYLAKNDFYGLFSTKEIIIYQSEVKQSKIAPEAQNYAVSDFSEVDGIADVIYNNESSRGKNCLKRCENIGKVNCIGYDPQKTCFDNHEEEMQVLKTWISRHVEEGMTDEELLSHYSGGDYTEIMK